MKKTKYKADNSIVIYQAKSGAIELKSDLAAETIWANLDQVATVFGRDKSVISRHIKNVFKDGELKRDSVVAFFATTAADGKTYKVEYFNLDVILSVGYRVNSIQATRFRQWATKTLKNHILKGYSINERRLRELNQTVKLIADTVKRRDLSGDEAKALLRVVGEYSYSLDLLDDYDHQRVVSPPTSGGVVHPLGCDEARRIVVHLCERFGGGSNFFGREKDNGLSSALGAVMQTFGGKDLYPSVEEKAAHLLYFLVKNHAFVDGNKRIGAALFLWFLEKNGILFNRSGGRRLSDAALVAITLLIASSKPTEKDIIVRITTHLLCERSGAE